MFISYYFCSFSPKLQVQVVAQWLLTIGGRGFGSWPCICDVARPEWTTSTFVAEKKFDIEQGS